MNDVPFKDRLFAHSKAIEELFSLLDKSFDIMNGRCPKKGIYRENWIKSGKNVSMNSSNAMFDQVNDWIYLIT